MNILRISKHHSGFDSIMGVIRQPRAAVAPSSGRSTDNSEANTAQNTDTESVTSSGTVTPVHRGQNGQQSGICPVQVRRNLGTHMHSLRMKKGRRTKQRLVIANVTNLPTLIGSQGCFP